MTSGFRTVGAGPATPVWPGLLLEMQLLGSTPTLCIQTLGGRPSRMCDSKSNKRCSLQLNCEKHWQKILLLFSNSAAPFSVLGFLLMIFYDFVIHFYHYLPFWGTEERKMYHSFQCTHLTCIYSDILKNPKYWIHILSKVKYTFLKLR